MPTPSVIYKGLLNRGLPQHIAEAFMDNFVAESGLNPGINEQNPLVEGSRGGRGLYQLTGPRRSAYEAAYGTDYDVDSQLDWLMYELSGPEKAAAEAIYATENREDAVRAITQRFLRPAKDNSEARIGMWKDETEQGVDNALRSFALDMDGAAQFVTDIMPSLNDEFNQTTEFALNLVNNPRGDNRVDASFAEAMPDTLPTGQRILPNEVASQNGASPVTFGTSGGNGGGVAGAPAEMGFVDRALAGIFPNIEDPADRRTKGSDILSALSMGLGQMSAGAPVDVSPVMARMQQRQQAAVEARQRDAARALQERRVDYEGRRLDLDERLAKARIAAQLAEQDGYRLPEEEISALMANPRYKDIASGLTDPDVNVRKSAYDAITDLRKKAAEDLVDDSITDSPAYQEFATELGSLTPDMSKVLKAGQKAGLTPNEMSSLINAAGVDPYDMMRNPEYYAQASDEEKATIDKLLKLSSGVPSNEDSEREFTFKRGSELYTQYIDAANTANKLQAPLMDILRAGDILLEKGGSTDEAVQWFNDKVADGFIALGSLAGDARTAEDIITKAFPTLDRTALAELDAADKFIMFEAGRQALANQGSVSNSERQAAAEAIVNSKGDPNARMGAIARLEAANLFDQQVADDYMRNKGKGFSNALELEEQYQRFRLEALPSIEQAMANTYRVQRAGLLGSKKNTDMLQAMQKELESGVQGPATAQYYEMTSPELTKEEFEFIKPRLPNYIKRYRLKGATDDNGNPVYVKIQR